MAESTHATGAAAAHGPAFPPFETGTFLSQLIWLAIAFGLLYWLMSKVALPRVASVLHARAERIAGDLREAQALRKQSEEAGSAYERSLAEAADKAKGIAQETREALATEAEIRRKALEAELAEKLAAAEATIRTRTDAAMANVRDIAADAAGAIVERLTGRPADGAKLRAALDRTVQA